MDSLLKYLNASQLMNISLGTILMIFSGMIFAHVISRLLEKTMSKFLIKKVQNQGQTFILAKFFRYGMFTILTLFVLDLAGISFKSISALGAIFMVGLTFGVQNLTQNLVAGLILLVERPLKIGDFITVGEFSGKVLEVNIRYTLLETPEYMAVVVPNSLFLTQTFINENYLEKHVRLTLHFTFKADADLGAIEILMLNALAQNAEVLQTPTPVFLATEASSVGIKIELRFWTANVSNKHIVLSTSYKELYKVLQVNRIPLAFYDAPLKLY